MSVRIVGLGGSLRASSSSLEALRLALAGAEAAGAAVELVDVRTLDLPMYDPERAGVPPAAERLAALVSAADGLIWSSPLYHGTVSGSFKNALDWLQLLVDRGSPFLTDRPVGLVATAAGVRSMQAINTMAFAVQALRGWTVPQVVAINQAQDVFPDDGSCRSPAIARQLDTLGRSVVNAARRLAA